jgi:hypothetical protein
MPINAYNVYESTKYIMHNNEKEQERDKNKENNYAV